MTTNLNAEIDMAKEAVQVKPTRDISHMPVVRGYDLNKGVDYDAIFSQYTSIGIQATNLGRSINIINKMIDWKLENDTIIDQSSFDKDDKIIHGRCRIFLGYTSSCVSSGLRDVIRFLCEHRMIDVVCTPATGIDEDLMKCFGDHLVKKFTDPV